jgi:LysR family cys regulon transcriptional activator
VGIVASTAIDPARDERLTALPGTEGLFARNTTKVALRKGVYLRGYAYAFLELFAPHLGQEYVQSQVFEPAAEQV